MYINKIIPSQQLFVVCYERQIKQLPQDTSWIFQQNTTPTVKWEVTKLPTSWIHKLVLDTRSNLTLKILGAIHFTSLFQATQHDVNTMDTKWAAEIKSARNSAKSSWGSDNSYIQSHWSFDIQLFPVEGHELADNTKWSDACNQWMLPESHENT